MNKRVVLVLAACALLPAPSPHMMNLMDNVSQLKLDVERVVHIHGGSSPYSDVPAAVGRPRSTN